ncbi:glycosyltransferase family 4 protein [Prevotella sp. RM4]|uniref:glycosyltransferase family 4 protein n=1 Tax=Prevotella sp. RM4 TaxID=1200547 RepID=UPI00051C99B8|nr:glycosyltransferase family 4 protein [Prevotella sp. RM4]
MTKVLVIATSRKTRGGITSVIKAHEQGEQWKKFHCHWVQTHRDGPNWRKLLYLFTAWVDFLIRIPFYDIVHIHCAGKTSGKRKIAFAKVASKLGKLIIVHFHPPGPQDIYDPVSHEIVRTLFDLANKVIVLSPYWERLINESYPDRNYPVEILWNPCPLVTRDTSNKKKQILFAGTICKRKGYDVLLKAFAKIAHKYPDWTLAFAGNAYFQDGIDEIAEGMRIAEEYDIMNQVKWLGWISGSEKEKVFQESAIYCLASEGEGFPMGVLDAWAYGIPCVMTPVGGIPDIVENGKNGLIFPVGDVESLAQKLTMLISDSDLRKRIVEESDKWTYGAFNEINVAKSLEVVYMNLFKS